jgi:hypothetical protein
VIPNYITHHIVARQVANLEEVERVALESGILTSNELDRRHLALKKADEEAIFFSGVSLVLAAGRKI